MSWERRAAKRYYYRKYRQGDRVLSEYVGAGQPAELAAALDAAQRQWRQAECDRWASRRALDARIDELCDLTHALACALLLAAGYRTHKGQWRKKRHA